MKRLTNLQEVARKKIFSYVKKDFEDTYNVEIEVRDLETFPSDPQALIYAKYKTTLHSHTDDI